MDIRHTQSGEGRVYEGQVSSEEFVDIADEWIESAGRNMKTSELIDKAVEPKIREKCEDRAVPWATVAVDTEYKRDGFISFTCAIVEDHN